MENKKTTELIELLETMTDDGYEDGTYDQIIGELRNREPFTMLLNREYEGSLPRLVDMVEILQEDVKKLKRHKHDADNGDVLVRI